MVMLFSIYSCHVVIVKGIVLFYSLKKIIFLSTHTHKNPAYFFSFLYFATRAAVPAAVAGTYVSIFSDF